MAALLLLAALVLGPLLAETSGTPGPTYTAGSIVNSASGIAGPYAANTFVSIYGSNLSYVTRAMGVDDLRGDVLPTVLIGTGLRVRVNSIEASIFYVSPTQVNLLVPSNLIPGPAIVQLVVDGLAGPAITIPLTASAPALFQQDPQTVIATHLDGALITDSLPARAGEVVVLYGTGFGATQPPAEKGRLARTAASITRMSDFQVWLNGAPVDSNRILYSGVTPGYAGLFQVNLKLPDDSPPNPEIRIGFPDRISPPLLYLPVR